MAWAVGRGTMDRDDYGQCRGALGQTWKAELPEDPPGPGMAPSDACPVNHMVLFVRQPFDEDVAMFAG